MDQQILRNFPFFSELTPDALGKLAALGALRDHAAGDLIFRLGEPASDFFGLVAGAVELRLTFTDRVLKTRIAYEESVHAEMVAEEQNILVARVAPGQVFGWSAIAGPAARTVNAVCSEDSSVFAMPAAGLKALFAADHTLGFVLMQRLCDIVAKRLQIRTDKLIEAWVEAFGISEI